MLLRYFMNDLETVPVDRLYYCIISISLIFFPVALLPPQAMTCSSLRLTRSHTTTHHSQQDSSGRVISSSHIIYLTKDNIHNRKTSVSAAGFEPTISAVKRLQTQVLDCAAAGIGFLLAQNSIIRYLLIVLCTCQLFVRLLFFSNKIS
jgi:hypothetical protein